MNEISKEHKYYIQDSCHPPSCTKNIPFSLCLRIVRICSKPENREKQFLKLKELLENRGYSGKTVGRAIERARGIPAMYLSGGC